MNGIKRAVVFTFWLFLTPPPLPPRSSKCTTPPAHHSHIDVVGRGQCCYWLKSCYSNNVNLTLFRILTNCSMVPNCKYILNVFIVSLWMSKGQFCLFSFPKTQLLLVSRLFCWTEGCWWFSKDIMETRNNFN